MKKNSILTVALIIAVASWLLSLALYVRLSQYDPYGWAVPGRENDLSRSLWLERRALYVWVAVIAFLITAALGLWKVWLVRRRPGESK